ncbi:FAD-dependent monooxygenase [Pseudonocardia sp. HH130630-07]|uniref:FAD-dependent monooxygenase n=1 Tax=Pseudonocardia sp. HH130630-07 TaxID=1690815 RepID=UPI000814E232|nr:FAD-dependent monooxygenase [Pseudonocardia sp. HH130630-07]ANY07761.1 FAD-dependent monooxygenase [Pseudonocardia sp. HH130630-07]
MNPGLSAVVVGSGIGGLSAAIALRRVGVDVHIYERASGIRPAGTALSLMSNAIAALDELGIDLGLAERGAVVRRFDIRTRRGRLMRRMPFTEICDDLGAPSVCISRSDLQAAMLDELRDPPLTTGATATGFEREPDGRVRVDFADHPSARADLLVGADGFGSRIREALAGPEPARDSGYVCWLAVVPFDHPRLTPGYIGHYWGAGQRFGLIDIGHGRAYWWGTRNMPATESANWTGGKAGVLRAFDGWAPEIREIVDRTPESSIIAVPSRDRAFLERWGSGPVTLLGDAAHPMLTSLGQGAGMAVEDAVVLAHSVSRAPDVETGLRAYEDARRDRTRAMVANSRAVSDMEQIERPVRRVLRDLYMRTVPRRVLTERARAALAFPGLAGVA